MLKKVPIEASFEGTSPSVTRSECCYNNVEWTGHRIMLSTRIS